MENIIDLNKFADGAFAEKFNTELRKTFENIADPNTDPTKARTVTMTVTLKGDEERNLSYVTIRGKSNISPPKDVQTKIILDRDRSGKVVGKELKSGIKGQMYIDDTGEILDDVGEKPAVGEKERNVVGFNKRQ